MHKVWFCCPPIGELRIGVVPVSCLWTIAKRVNHCMQYAGAWALIGWEWMWAGFWLDDSGCKLASDWMRVDLTEFLSVWLWFCQYNSGSVKMTVVLLVWLWFYQSDCGSTYQSDCGSVSLSDCGSVSLSVVLSVCLWFCQSVCGYVSILHRRVWAHPCLLFLLSF